MLGSININLILGNNNDKVCVLLPGAEPAYKQYLASLFVKNCISDIISFL